MQISVDRNKSQRYVSATISDIKVEDYVALQTALHYHAQYMFDNNFHNDDDPEIRAMYERAAELLDAFNR